MPRLVVPPVSGSCLAHLAGFPKLSLEPVLPSELLDSVRVSCAVPSAKFSGKGCADLRVRKLAVSVALLLCEHAGRWLFRAGPEC